jgi:hypothetical protein
MRAGLTVVPAETRGAKGRDRNIRRGFRRVPARRFATPGMTR